MGLFMDWKWLFITNCYLLYSYITAVSIWTIEQTLHSFEWHCIRSILTSNYLFLRLFLRTRKHYFSLILFPPVEIYDFPRRHTTSYRRWNDVVCLQGYIYNALQQFLFIFVFFFLKYNPVEHICNIMFTRIILPFSKNAQKNGS